MSADPELDHDDLVARLSAAGGGVRPRGDASGVVQRAVARDRRRRSRRTAVGAVAAVAVVVGAAGLGQAFVGRGGVVTPGAIASAPPLDADRPAVVFEDTLGGDTRGYAQRYHLVPGERMHGQFQWWPAGRGSGPSYLAGVALEYRGTASCDALLAGAATCSQAPGGGQLAAYDVPAADAAYDPLHAAARFPARAAGVTVRGVSLYSTSGLVVSVYVCTCTVEGEPIRGAEPPASIADLTDVALQPVWLERSR